MDVPSFIAVVLAGVLAGSELTSWAIVHPALWKLDHRAQVRAEKLMYRRFASIDPFLMTATVAACFAAAASLEGRLGHAGARCGRLLRRHARDHTPWQRMRRGLRFPRMVGDR